MTVNDARIAANQAPPLQDYDAFSTDDALVEAVDRHGSRASLDGLAALGRLAGSHRTLHWAEQANIYGPVLRTHDRYGNRIDEVEFHPAWHHLMEVAVTQGLAGAAWSGGAVRARDARRRVHGVEHCRSRARMPDLDDVRRVPALAPTPRSPRSGSPDSSR